LPIEDSAVAEVLKNPGPEDSGTVATLERRGISPTPQRVRIARELLGRPQHLSAEQILERVNRRGAAVSKATVYNTLKLFTQKGLVREVIVDPSRVFYDSNIDSHHHFFNVDTGELEDIPIERVEFSRFPALPKGTFQDGVDVIIRVRRNRRDAT
jgi:Fur family transcriptional regulator, iron response regulator